VRLLLDEELPRHLARHLTGHQVRTVKQEGWAGVKNGVLLQRAEEAGVDVFVTADQNREVQQVLSRARLGVVVLAARILALEDLQPLVPAALAAIGRVGPGEVIRVAA